MADHIALDADVLRAHAGRIEQVSQDVHLAAEAAASLHMADGAFGLMCAFLVPPALLVNAAGRNVIDAAANLIDRAAIEVREWALEVEELEHSMVHRVGLMMPEAEIEIRYEPDYGAAL